ncbi:MAG: type IV secretory system conjugative DNA transfer family protein [Patescibacteria group bacterium]
MMIFQLNVVPPIDQAIVVSFVGSPLFYAVIIGLVVLIVSAAIVTFFRNRIRSKYQTGAAFNKVVMLVTVPKESAEKGDSGQREKTLAEIQEDIAVMTNVFASIGGLRAQRGSKAALVGRDDSFSFELVVQDGLISFYIVCNADQQDFIEQQLQAQYNHAQIDIVKDYNIFSSQGQTAAATFKFKRQNFLPIRSFKQLDSDPLNAVTNALSKVEKGDGAAVQIVVRSAKKGWRELGLTVAREMSQGKKFSDAVGKESFWKFLADYLKTKKPTDEPKKDYHLSDREQEMVKSIEEKAGQMGLDVNIRIITSARHQAKADMYLNNIAGAFSQYNIPQFGNELGRSDKHAGKIVENFIFRHFDEKQRSVMVGDELSSIYHLPLASTETPNIRWLMARKSAPPSNIPTDGMLLGSTEYRGKITQIFQKHDDRFRHMYIIGGSGSGKSEFIAKMIEQDIKAGFGVGVIDPHGDLVETALSAVPKERAEDVVLFDPADYERPMGLNMLESPSEEMDDFVVGEMIAIFYKLFPPEMIGPMFEHTMRNMMLTLMADRENPGTIAEIPRLVTDAAFQKKWIAKVKDPVVRSYWENEVANTSDFHKSEMFGYLTSKVGRFVENAMMRNIIGQQKSAFDFRDVMDNKKILLVNLSKGKIGDVNANLLGLIMVTKLQMAAMARADMPKEQRNDFFLYIDEFQNFVTPSIATILSEARKYRLSLTIAHQYIAQLAPKGDTEIRDAVIGNVGTKLAGRIGVDDAQFLEKEYSPVFSAYDLMNVDKFHWNTKLLIDNTVSRPFVMKSPPMVVGNKKLAAAVKQLARLKYGRDRLIVSQEIMERTQIKAPSAGDPAGLGSGA